jgi:hypothetical protein
MKAPDSPLLRAIDDVRLLARVPSEALSTRAGYSADLWQRWAGRTPMTIKALEDVCESLGVKLVVVPRDGQ